METRSRLRRKTTTGAPANTDLRPWELCWHTDGKLYIGVGDTDGHATTVEQISGAGASWLGSMAFINDAPSDGTGYVRKDGAWAVESAGVELQPNLIANPNTQDGTNGWTESSATISVATHDDRSCFSVSASFSFSAAYMTIPVTAGNDYSYSADVSASAGSPSIAILWLNGSGSSLGSSSATLGDVDGHFHRISVSGTAPASTVNARLLLQSIGAGNTAYIARLKLERSSAPTPYSEEAATQLLSNKGDLDGANTWTAVQTFSGGIALSGTTSQYVRGDGTLATLPSAGSGTVTSVSAGSGMSFSTFTTSGAVTLGTPSTCTASTSNAVTSTSHTHAITGFLPLTGGTLTGTLTGTTIQGTTIRETSDRRLKRDIHALTDQTSGIMQLTPVRYRRAATECVELGLIAQDVRRVYPEAVGEDSDGMLSLAYQRLIAPMLDVMQRQQRRIDALERKLEAMQ